MLSKFMWLVRKAITFIHKNRRKKRRILCDTKYVGQFEAREGLTFSISCCFPFSLAAWLPIKLTLRDGQASAGIGFQFLISYMQQFWRQGDITNCQSQQQTKRTSVTKRVRGDNVMIIIYQQSSCLIQNQEMIFQFLMKIRLMTNSCCKVILKTTGLC